MHLEVRVVVPEILEIEVYRKLAERVVGRTISSVDVFDDWYFKGEQNLADKTRALLGCKIFNIRRLGKMLILDLNSSTLGLRFGMTGILLVDGLAAIERLQWGSRNINPSWERFGIKFKNGGRLSISDPRRLGGVQLDPNEKTFGPDAWSLTAEQLEKVLANSKGSLKSRLLNQKHLAGLGNLLVDEVLWQAGLSPLRCSGILDDQEKEILRCAIKSTLEVLKSRGGSHTGDLMANRIIGGCCPRDGQLLKNQKVAGRSTWWCPAHQH